MKYNLLQITQKVLSSIEGDEVSGIGDTIESRQVVEIIERVYNQLVSRGELPEDYRLFQLEPTTSATPTLMTRPNSIDDVQWVKYNSIKALGDDDNVVLVRYLDNKEFDDYLMTLNESESNVSSFTKTGDEGSVIKYLYINNEPPKYWTSFDDSTIVFDACNLEVESNLQKSQTRCFGRYIKTFNQIDTFTPGLDDGLFPLLISESISTAWAELKQSSNPKAEKNARQGWISAEKRKQDLPRKRDALSRAPNYGRK